MKTARLIVFAALLLSGCATAYQPQGLTGGFSETAYGAELFRVHFDGNGYTSGVRAQDFALLRAAEIAQSKGFSHFAVLDEKSDVRAYTTPSSSYTTGTVTTVGSSAIISANTNTVGGMTFHKPATGLLVQLCAQDFDQGLVLEASAVIGSIRLKYKIKNSAADSSQH